MREGGKGEGGKGEEREGEERRGRERRGEGGKGEERERRVVIHEGDSYQSYSKCSAHSHKSHTHSIYTKFKKC